MEHTSSREAGTQRGAPLTAEFGLSARVNDFETVGKEVY